MMTLKTANEGHDRVIKALLDELVAETQYDPSSIVPDYKLGVDLGLSRIQIQTVLYRTAQALGLNVSFENCRVEDSSPRDLMQLLRGWEARSSRKSA